MSDPARSPSDPRRWRVTPAPDGRGTLDEHKPRPPHRVRGFWTFVLVVLAANWLLVLVLPPGAQPRVTVPFTPYFVSQVQAGNVKSISSTGDTIEGTFASAVRYPAGDAQATPTTHFSTQVPSFWSDAQLTSLLQSKGVQVDARSSGTSLGVELLLGFGPTLLLVGLFILLGRRAAAGGGLGGLSAFGRSGARRADPQRISATFDDVAGIDDAKAELSEIVDFLRSPEKYGRWAAGCRTACCCSAFPARARRCSPGRSRGRRTRRSSRSRRRSSSRRSSAWARRACATCSRRPRRPRRRSSSSTSSTRSAARARARPA
jgi:cell division protease FtsH